MEDFRKYATKHLGMNSNALDSYMNITSSYISPTIIEERQLNVAQMDVFSRLMMDRTKPISRTDYHQRIPRY